MATYTIFAGVNEVDYQSCRPIYYEENKAVRPINLYDNTLKFRHVAYMNNGIIIWKSDITPKWIGYILK